jgi:hypothetical protein
MSGRSYPKHPRGISGKRCVVFLEKGDLLRRSNHRIGRESDRTLRDGFFGWRCPRHFVPGYDRTVPSGTKADRPSECPFPLNGTRKAFDYPVNDYEKYV